MRLRLLTICKIGAVMTASLLLLSGCQWLDDLRASILQKTDETVGQVTKTVENAGKKLEETKASVEKKIDDVKNAAKEVNEAVEAVKKVGE